jgi:WD40 repeat protein
MTEPKVAHRDSPYFGLDYYDERFGAWFFGRESDGSKIITNLRAARLTLLHAESGVGKTSLLRAGVAWRLHRLADDMSAKARPVRSIPIVFSSWKDDPATELAAAVGAAVRPYLGNGGMPAPAGGPLDAAVEAASGAVNASLLIMLDQFEEYFLYRSREPVPERFADELARCVNRTDLRANFVIAIREDAYAELGDLFKGRITNVYGNYLHIDYLDRASAEKAIRGPVDVYNSQPGVAQPVTVQDELVEAVLDEVRAFGRDGTATVADGDRDRIATPLLQLVMQRVWDTERAEGSADLRLSTLQRLRGVRMIVDDHLGKALGSLNGGERETAIDMFDHLVTPSGGKIAESVSDLAKRTGHPVDQVDGVLRKLDDERILRPVPAAPGQDPVRSRRYEIFHDVLASPINRAIAAREEQRRVRRFRRLAALAVALLVVVTAVAVVFAYLLNSANTEKLTAESRQLAADAELNLARDPELSTQLAMQALSKRTTAQAEASLRAALPELQTVRTFQDTSTVFSAEFDPADNNKVASSDLGGTASIWDVRTGKRLVRMSLGGFNVTGSADHIAYDPSGTEIAVGYGNGVVALFDALTGKKLQSVTASTKVINNMAFLGSTGKLAIASEQNLVVWQPGKEPACCDVLSPHPAYALAADPDDPRVFAVTTGSRPVVWNLANPAKPRARQFGNGTEKDAEFSADGTRIVTADSNGDVDIYDLSTLKQIATLRAGDASALRAAFSVDGKRIVAGYSSGTTRVWDVATHLPLMALANGTGGVNFAQFSKDGNDILTGGFNSTIRVSYAQPRELQAEFSTPPSGTPYPITEAGYTGNRIIAVDNYGNVDMFGASGDPLLTSSLNAEAAAWDKAGTKLVTEGTDGTVDVYEVSGASLSHVPFSSAIQLAQLTTNIAMSPDGSRFETESNNFTIEVRSTDTGDVLQTLHARNPIEAVAFNPSDRQVAAVDENGRVEIWNGAGAKPQLLGSPGPMATAIDFSKSGSEIVTVATDGTVRLWSTHGGRALNSINACQSPSTASFSPDGGKVVVACGDGTVQVFGAENGRTLTVLHVTSAGVVTSAAFSPDGTSIVAAVNAGNTGYLEVWNAELTTSSLTALERIAGLRVAQRLTEAQLQQYLNGAGS